MPRRDAYALVNLSLGRKVAATLGLLAGMALFVGGVAFSVLLTNWQLTVMGFLGWGGMLMRVRAFAGPWFQALFVAHLLSLGLVGVIAFRLFRRVALPRRGRALATSLLVVLAALDLLCLLLLPLTAPAPAPLAPPVLPLPLP